MVNIQTGETFKGIITGSGSFNGYGSTVLEAVEDAIQKAFTFTPDTLEVATVDLEIKEDRVVLHLAFRDKPNTATTKDYELDNLFD